MSANFTIDQWSGGIGSWGWFFWGIRSLRCLSETHLVVKFRSFFLKYPNLQNDSRNDYPNRCGKWGMTNWPDPFTMMNSNGDKKTIDSDSSLCVEWNVHLDLWIYTLSYVYVTYVYFLILYTYILCYACNIYIYIRTYLYIFGRDRNRNPNPKHKKDRIQALDCLYIQLMAVVFELLGITNICVFPKSWQGKKVKQLKLAMRIGTNSSCFEYGCFQK